MIFHLDCEPPKSTHQSNVRIFKGRNEKRYIGKSKIGKTAEASRLLARLLAPHAPSEPMTGPISLSVRWVYSYRVAEPQRNRGLDIPCDKRPDCDNLAKGLLDIMTSCGFWIDDGQISELCFGKYWGSTPGINIEINHINLNDE